jgi:hypothetical protein
MKTCLIVLLLTLAFTTAVCADYMLPAVDFFMHGRQYEMYLRDHFRFDEPRPLQIEYDYTKWLDSNSISSEYADHLSLETDLPIYSSQRVFVDIPFSYSRLPVWAESEKINYGATISMISPSIVSRVVIANKFKSIIGIEYNLKGDSEAFGKSDGRMICVPNLVLSYDLLNQLNIMAGGRLERYYYDTNDTDYAMELADRLYLRPIAMLNWHPNDNFAILLGLPYLGGYVTLAKGIIKAEARATINQNFEVGLRIRPIDKTNVTLRLLNIPYKEIPVEGFITEAGNFLKGRIDHTRRTFSFEAGRELNPAAIASLGVQYVPGSDVNFTGKDGQKYPLNGKPNYSIGVKFTVDIEALFQLK